MSDRLFSIKSAYASTLATAALIAISIFSVAKFQQIFEPFGRDLPAITLLLMDSYKYWVLVPVASLIFLAYAHIRASKFAYRAVQVLLLVAVFSIPFAHFGIYAPVVSG